MRGKGDDVVYGLGRVRITPAYAGKRWCTSGRRSAAWDHPRVCGEKSEARSSELPTGGSPPRMRGKGSRCRTLQHRHRITPTYAGKRAVSLLTGSRILDHPRVCGEKPRCVARISASLGSPPRMRGKVVAELSDNRFDRITPAYAGKRFLRLFCVPYREDHPRVCGEK